MSCIQLFCRLCRLLCFILLPVSGVRKQRGMQAYGLEIDIMHSLQISLTLTRLFTFAFLVRWVARSVMCLNWHQRQLLWWAASLIALKRKGDSSLTKEQKLWNQSFANRRVIKVSLICVANLEKMSSKRLYLHKLTHKKMLKFF